MRALELARSAALAAACIASSAHASPTFTPSPVVPVHVERSLYRNIYVYEVQGTRCMTFSRSMHAGRQACVSVSEPDLLVFDYTKAMLAAVAARPGSKRILAIGIGGGTLPMALAKVLPDSQIDAVEIDPAVISVAKTYFGLRETPRLRLHEQDGRVFLRRALASGVKYDIVMLDAFDHEYVPEHLLTREFFTEVRKALVEDGLIVANTFSRGRLYHHESATYADVFGPFYNVRAGNRVVLAKLGGLPSIEKIRAAADVSADALRSVGVEPEWFSNALTPADDWSRSARVLTDQFSPSNLLNR